MEGAGRLFLECQQIYVKVFGADHEETLDAAMCALTVGEEKEEEQGEEEDSDQGEEEEGSWKKMQNILPPRAAEDAPVTAQHDVPRWARGR